jgi:hypothetical protein
MPKHTIELPELAARSDAETNALAALEAATVYAKQLQVFLTSASVLTENDDAFNWAVSHLAQLFFHLDDAELERLIKRIPAPGYAQAEGDEEDLGDAIEDLVLHQRGAFTDAAFALGVAWGRLEGAR